MVDLKFVSGQLHSNWAQIKKTAGKGAVYAYYRNQRGVCEYRTVNSQSTLESVITYVERNEFEFIGFLTD